MTREQQISDARRDPRPDRQAAPSAHATPRDLRHAQPSRARPDLDGASAERFEKLTAQIDAALASATEAKDAVVSSFDVLILRTEHRTNEIMKVLTLASILLLPGALIAGVMGMNVNFSAGTFAGSPLFWIVIVLIVAIALATLGFARAQALDLSGWIAS